MLRRRSPMIISSKRVGIFAGSFDPIHDGHLAVAQTCLDNLELDKVYFMVESEPWGDKSPINVDHRRSMVEIAIADIPKLGQFMLEDKQFSINDTLKTIEKKFPDTELYFIFGSDIFLHMSSSTWPKLEQLFKHYIVVIERGEITEDQIAEHAKELGIVTAILPSEHLKHSSTDVRLFPHKKAIWVPEQVSSYIDKNNLYQKT